MKKSILGILLVILMMTNAYAEENKTTEGKSDWFAFGVLELAAVANSYAASKSPGGYGAGMIILYPLFKRPENTKRFWGGWAVISMIPAYNFYLDRELTRGKITRKDIFKRNMIAWNVLGAGAYLWFNSGEKEESGNESNVSLGVAPLEDGLELSMHYQF